MLGGMQCVWLSWKMKYWPVSQNSHVLLDIYVGDKPICNSLSPESKAALPKYLLHTPFPWNKIVQLRDNYILFQLGLCPRCSPFWKIRIQIVDTLGSIWGAHIAHPFEPEFVAVRLMPCGGTRPDYFIRSLSVLTCQNTYNYKSLFSPPLYYINC